MVDAEGAAARDIAVLLLLLVDRFVGRMRVVARGGRGGWSEVKRGNCGVGGIFGEMEMRM